MKECSLTVLSAYFFQSVGWLPPWLWLLSMLLRSPAPIGSKPGLVVPSDPVPLLRFISSDEMKSDEVQKQIISYCNEVPGHLS